MKGGLHRGLVADAEIVKLDLRVAVVLGRLQVELRHCGRLMLLTGRAFISSRQECQNIAKVAIPFPPSPSAKTRGGFVRLVRGRSIHVNEFVHGEDCLAKICEGEAFRIALWLLQIAR